ncbi:hypothetical protein SAMN05216282_105137 [Cryobacterium psychrotolerans]|uniref:AAA ATPase domain-containing protein n=1 Tax=Cryobacterium psychrotolerans TaxID=386301 RepID=A0A1G9BCN6_9MICO|nr:hypothetical protein [Cryobacterium psychrotolerans]TFD84706.1 hypothetical protein E3T56_09640 [Cryobacterium psychrotolerans]SDK37251.1 hypothetical protein SAMN05216282_105137 [Cryobacterium psychrotolerans]
MDKFERGHAAMRDLVTVMEEAALDDVNEADTRFRVINKLLTDVLHWPIAAVQNELHTDSGYMNYCVGMSGAQFVLEAKRAGRAFSLPVGLTSSVVSIPSIASGAAGKPLKEALQQAARYAQERGIPIASAFNGHQLVIFLASRTDGLAPLEGRALVFATPQSMQDEFVVLWNNLSPQGMSDRTLYQTLQSAVPLPPDPLSFRLPNYPGSQRRNDIQTGLQILSDLFLGDLEDLEDIQEDFLRECYASSGALSQYADVSKQILAARYELLSELGGASVQKASDRKGVTKGFTSDVMQAALSNRPVILLGDVGSGKSTFIERLIHVDAKEVLGESISIYVDFGASSTLKALSDHVLDACIEQLRDKYDTNILGLAFAEDALRADTKLFDESPLGSLKDVDATAYASARIQFIQNAILDRASYIEKSLAWIRKSWRRQIVIFLDNVDQRSGEDQNQVFLIANELAQSWPATVFVTLRPETFYLSEREGAISGYHPRVFTISPPRTDVMLRLRVEFALRQLQSSGRLGSFPNGIKVNSDSLEVFLTTLAENFRTNDQLMRLVDNLAGGNMRMALQFVTDFVGSGHIDTEKIIDVQRRSGSYTIPIHEFLRSMMFGDYRYYDPDSSPIPNLFRLTRRDAKEHFLIPLCLAYIQKAGELETEHGYVSGHDVYSYLQAMGFEPAQVSDALEYSLRFRLLDSTRKYGRKTDDEVFRITTVGAYCYKALADKFTYIDAVSVDLPILDDEVRARVRDTHTLVERVERAQLIADYLDDQWKQVPSSAGWDWAGPSGILHADIARVRSRTVGQASR